MNKVVLPAVIVLAAAGAAGGIKYTADQSHKGIQQFVENLNSMPQYQGLLEAELSGTNGFLESSYQVKIKVVEPEIAREMNTLINSDSVPFTVKVKNGFLSANYDIQFADSELLTKIKANQTNPQNPPLHVLVDAGYNPMDQTLTAEQTFLSEKFVISNTKRGVESEFEVGALNARTVLNGQSLEGDGKMGDLVGRKNGTELFRMSGISFVQTGMLRPGTAFMNGEYESFDVTFNIGQIKGEQGSRNGGIIEINDLKFGLKQDKNGDRVVLSTDSSMGAVTATPTTPTMLNVKNANLDMAIDLDADAFHEFNRQYSQMPQAQRQNPMLLMGIVGGLTAKGINLNLDGFNFNTEQGVMNASGNVTVPGFNLMQVMQNPNAVMETINGEFSFGMDESLANALPDKGAQRELRSLSRQGLVKKQDGKLVSEISIVNGKVTVNGVPMG